MNIKHPQLASDFEGNPPGGDGVSLVHLWEGKVSNWSDHEI